MKRIFISIYLWIACIAVLFAQSSYKLVWSDEFNQDGLLDTAVWNYEGDLLVMKNYNGISRIMLTVKEVT